MDPAFLISFMSAEDEREGTTFSFAHVREPLGPDEIRFDGNAIVPPGSWRWQRSEIDDFHAYQRLIRLKARQLGESWLACAYCVWVALYKPGALCLIYRQKENDAFDNIKRCWQLFASLPPHLRNSATIEKPARIPDPIPTGELRLRFPVNTDTGVAPSSTIQAMTSASASGHGRTAAVVVLDEFSRIDNSGEIRKAVEPAAGQRGKIIVVSTANGVSNPETGEGNQFHWLWANSGNYHKRFLHWKLHPDRDDDWYATSPEIADLKAHERAEQYPSNEDEAFTLTNRTFFEPESLQKYFDRVEQPLYRLDFERKDARAAAVKKRSNGLISVYREPQEGHSYAVGADVASGRGRDYSVAYVIDLGTMELAAEFRGRLDADQYAYQLHYLGKWYRDALMAVETAGGWGEAVIIPLRDGREGRPAYPRLYRHVMSSRPSQDVARVYGFPTNTKTRPLILNQLEKAVREESLPFVTRPLLDEMKTFNLFDTGTSPRAQDGCHDDCVMAAAIALEMYRLRGEHPDRTRPKARRRGIVGVGRR